MFLQIANKKRPTGVGRVVWFVLPECLKKITQSHFWLGKDGTF